MSEVRVRFAPSPTGYLHVGGARTALFNWLFARKHHGTFILRIEDTDQYRSSEPMTEGILDGLRWLEIDWDEGPYYQSQNLNVYHAYGQKLVDSKAAYFCFCSPESLKHKQQSDVSRLWKYDRACLNLTSKQLQDNLEKGVPHVVRFKVPSGKTIFDDLVHGRIEVDNDNIEDFVLLRSDSLPTYHLSVVADDLEMRITHIIRGDDHLSNTPKQLLLYQALGKQAPEFVHLPLILGPDKHRLSKRHGATSVLAYRDMGYVPEAVVNFLALLGWSPGANREILTRNEMVDLFAIENVNKTNAVFDLKKLEWMNSQYIRSMLEEKLFPLVKRELERVGLWRDDFQTTQRQRTKQIIHLLKTRIKRITDFSNDAKAYFTDEFDYDPQAVERYLNEPNLLETIVKLRERYASLPLFDLQATEHELRRLAEEQRMKAGGLIGAVRVALTGGTAAPGIFDVIVTLGRAVTLKRLDRLVAFLHTKVVGSPQ